MWRVYFYGEIATPETVTLARLADCVRAIGIPEDLEWFEMANIEWQAVNAGFIYRQFAGRGEPPTLRLVHQQK